MTCLRRLTAAAAFFSLAVFARADYIKGFVYSVPDSTASNLDNINPNPSLPPPASTYPGSGSNEIATFLANGINFTGNTGSTIAQFLNSGGTASDISYMNGASSSTTVAATLFEFFGYTSFMNGAVYNLGHDDGAELYVNGLNVLDAPTAIGGTGNYVYNGPTGTYLFEFVYSNSSLCCNADFTTNLIPSAAATGVYVSPEPSTALLPLAGLGLLALGWFRRRKLI